MMSRTDAHSLSIEIDGDTAIVHIPTTQFGSMDAGPADEHLLFLIEEVQQTQVSLDFGNVSFVSSIGLALLLRLHKHLSEGGRHLAIVNVQPLVYEVFVVTHLNTVLDVRQQETA